MSNHPEIASAQLKGLGLLAEALTYPDTGETIELITATDGSKWFWLHEVAEAADLPNLKTTYRRTLDGDEWQTIDVSAGQSTSTNNRHELTSPNAKRVLLSLPGTIKVLTVARKNPKARAFDRWARHEVLAPLLTTNQPAPDDPKTRDYVDSLLALAVETQAGMLSVQQQQSETMVKLTEILDRVTANPPRGPGARTPQRRKDEAAGLLESWRSRHLLSKDVWAVAAYALPIILEHGNLQASPRKIAERTGLDVALVNRALLDLCLAGCLRPVGETSRSKHTIYELGQQ